MFARLHSAAPLGTDAIRCEAEVDVAERGFAGPSIVGLPDATVTLGDLNPRSLSLACSTIRSPSF
jgi:hypothetical protein